MDKLKVYIKLLRPFTMVAPFVSGIVFSIAGIKYYNLQLFDYIFKIILGSLTLALANATSNVINQVWDIEEDRNNPVKCKRPVASGQITEKEAMTLAFFGLIMILLLSSLINTTFVLLVGITMVFVFIYSVPPIRTKKRLWWNNITIAIPRGIIGILASVSIVGNPFNIEFICVGVIISMFTLAVNPTKDISDIEGDKIAGIRNLCTVYGIKKAMYISSLFLILTYVITIIFVWFNYIANGWLFVIAILPVGLAILWLMLTNPEKKFRGENTALWYLFYIQMVIIIISWLLCYSTIR